MTHPESPVTHPEGAATDFVAVGVPVPLGRSFTYRVPPGMAVQPGTRVLCQFGTRKVLAIVLETGVDPPDLPADKIRDLVAVVDPEPVLADELLSFLIQLGAYYFAPIGEVLRLALPAVERDKLKALSTQGKLALGEGLSRTKQVGGREQTFVVPTAEVEKPGTLRGQAAAVLALLRGSGEHTVARLSKQYGNARVAVKKLEALGLVRTERRRVRVAALFDEPAEPDDPPELTDAQRVAVKIIRASFEQHDDGARVQRGFLLFGVTGSGKTEVYMHAIAACLERGRGALILVPEIALTPQLVRRFRSRFGDAVAVLHSGLADRDRHEMWRKLRQAELRVAVGARSALFAPVCDLGLIVVDEEHDGSFKQEEGVRYHARDMAILRAHRADATLVLGSATPSLESVALVKRDKLQQIRLPERATRASLPSIEIVDLKRNGPGPSGNRLLSLPLHRGIESALSRGEQTIIFLNRRGFAPAVICDACGVVSTCEDCAVALTYHRRYGGRLRCHYCDFQAELAGRCSACSVGALALVGTGTEQLESSLAQSFPEARVARLDRDVAGGIKSIKVLNRMRAGEIDILVGTQMVTKGHDLPAVTVVGVVNADAALSMPDFRAAERGFQLLVQVAGRAGRHDRPGRVFIQTRNPEHPAVAFAARQDVEGFLTHELADRGEVGYPPFARLALVRIDARDEDLARSTAARIAAHARTTVDASRGELEVLGPAPAPIPRLRSRYRFRVMLRAKTRRPLRAAVAVLRGASSELDRNVRIIFDIDPVSML